MPTIQAAGRFLAPAGRYFPDLLPEPVSEEDLLTAAVAPALLPMHAAEGGGAAHAQGGEFGGAGASGNF